MLSGMFQKTKGMVIASLLAVSMITPVMAQEAVTEQDPVTEELVISLPDHEEMTIRNLTGETVTVEYTGTEEEASSAKEEETGSEQKPRSCRRTGIVFMCASRLR